MPRRHLKGRMIVIALVPSVSAVGPAAPLYSDHCAVQDAAVCVNKTGCGFCLTSWTCMAGDVDGPVNGSLPCVPLTANLTIILGGCTFASSWSELMKCQHKQAKSGHCTDNCNPFAQIPPSVTTFDVSVPAEWDNLCVAGGQRHWGGCFLPYPESKCLDLTPVHAAFGMQYCECPAGRNGQTCGGCTSGAGCAAGDECIAPALLPPVGSPTKLSCRVPHPANVSFGFLAQYVIGIGPIPSFAMTVSESSYEGRLTKAADFPYGEFDYLLTGPAAVGNGKGSRVLSGISFIGAANNSGTCQRQQQQQQQFLSNS